MSGYFGLATAALFTLGAVASTCRGGEPVTVTKAAGVVSVQADDAVAGGRLPVRIVAKNLGDRPTRLANTDIKVYGSDGTTLKLVTLDELISELAGSVRRDGSQSRFTVEHQQADYSQNESAALRDTSGGLVQGSQNGAAAMTNGSRPAQLDSQGGRSNKSLDSATQQQIAALRAGVLQNVDIAPGQIAGGQIVVDVHKQAGRVANSLRLEVQFNGEQYELAVVIPEAQHTTAAPIPH